MKKTMKNGLLIAAAAVVALSSCSKDERVRTSSTDGQILLNPSLMKPHTKGAEVTGSNLTNFAITAVAGDPKIVAIESGVTKQNDGTWTFDEGAQYWPTGGGTMDFYAIANGEHNAAPVAGAALTAPVFNADGSVQVSYTIPGEKDNQQDVIYATNIGLTESEGAQTTVNLKFKHALAQIELKAKNTNSSYTVKVLGARLNNLPKGGTLKMPTTSTADGGTVTLSDLWVSEEAQDRNFHTLLRTDQSDVARTLGETPVRIMFENNDITGTGTDNFMVLPATREMEDFQDGLGDGTYISVLCRIVSTNDEETVIYPTNAHTSHEYVTRDGERYAYVAVGANFKALELGKKYVYTLDFSNGAGIVDPEKPNPDPENPGPKPDPVFGSEIKLSVTVEEWDDTAGNTDVVMPSEVPAPTPTV